MQALHTRGDCFVSLCRSEGWGIPAFDAAAYGNPVVITGYGGQLDYLDPESAELVEYELVGVDDPLGFPSFSPDQLWAEPSVAHAAERLRWVFEHREEAAERASAFSQRLLRTYTPSWWPRRSCAPAPCRSPRSQGGLAASGRALLPRGIHRAEEVVDRHLPRDQPDALLGQHLGGVGFHQPAWGANVYRCPVITGSNGAMNAGS